MENSNPRLFWLLNILFWLVFYTINGVTGPPFLSIILQDRILLILTFLFWVFLLTGTYRYVYQKLKIWEKPLSIIIVQCVVAIVALMFFDYYIRFNINYKLCQLFNFDPEDSHIYSDKLYTDPYLSLLFKHVYTFGQYSKLMAYAIWVTSFNFYRYSGVLKGTLIDKLKVENQLKEAELINLRSQLNPHFLFNSLNSIHSLALTQSEKTSDAVLLLSDLMRYTLNYEKKDLVTIEEEIEVVTKYLALEKIRFGNRLNFSMDIDPATLNQKIPPIIIQTLAENAIKHSISQNTEGGYISIKTYTEVNNLIIEIKNTGQLKHKTSNKGGIGLENTKKRLQMFWREKANLSLQNLNESEVLARVQIPFA